MLFKQALVKMYHVFHADAMYIFEISYAMLNKYVNSSSLSNVGIIFLCMLQDHQKILFSMNLMFFCGMKSLDTISSHLP